jgi:Uma2 family endonuclease
MSTDASQQQLTVVPGVTVVTDLEHFEPVEGPSVDHLVTEDDTPVDNLFSEKQQRLLTEPLYSSWKPDVSFLTMANVGLFCSANVPPMVPDVLLSMDVVAPSDLFPKSHHSYFVWEYGKPPDVVIEIVSNKEGGEATNKLQGYARGGVDYYIIYDPFKYLSEVAVRFYELRGGVFQLIEEVSYLMPSIGLGLKVWQGAFEGHVDMWLRWTDMAGNLIQTGAELADSERARADSEQARADSEQARADSERDRANAIEEQLRRLGVKPEQ